MENLADSVLSFLVVAGKDLQGYEVSASKDVEKALFLRLSFLSV